MYVGPSRLGMAALTTFETLFVLFSFLQATFQILGAIQGTIGKGRDAGGK